MGWMQSILGILLLTGVIFGWVVLQKKMRGDESPLFSSPKRKRDTNSASELEAFIAAYRDGQLSPEQLQSGTADAGKQPAAAVVASHATAPATVALSPAPFLRPEVKLAYLIARAGLRDHHVFANVRLSDLGRGETAGAVDLLICNGQFESVAAIDVSTRAPVNDPAKAGFLRAANIRYLRFSAAAMPKPAELHALIYRA